MVDAPCPVLFSASPIVFLCRITIGTLGRPFFTSAPGPRSPSPCQRMPDAGKRKHGIRRVDQRLLSLVCKTLAFRG
eukprot:2204852-Pyramimonas_sp.AAC.1